MAKPSRIGLRISLLAVAAVSLLAGLCGGMWRLGWVLPHGASLAALHGPLMISGLFGALISLERAVAIGRGWPYLAPAFAAIGSLVLILGAPPVVGMIAYVIASVVLAAASVSIARQQPALFTGSLLFGSLAWLVGNVLWALGGSLPEVVGWWLVFLVLTIAGERLELSRLLEPKRGSEALFLSAIGLLAVGARNGISTDNGSILFGLGLLSCTAWLLRHDIAMRNIRRSGQTRFSAACMLAGYLWLGVAGLVLVLRLPGAATFGYDMALHAILIGFVISMVFGHALIILPAVVRVRVRYRALLYAPLALLHASLVVRLIGDLCEVDGLRLASGPLTLTALLGFAACVGLGLRGGRRSDLTASTGSVVS